MDWKYTPSKDKKYIYLLIAVLVGLIVLNFFIFKSKNFKEDGQEVVESNSNFFYTPTQDKNISETKNSGRYNLNTLSSNTLSGLLKQDTLLAARIIAYRNILRGYHEPKQLLEVSGLDTKTYQSLLEVLEIIPEHDSIYINRETFDSLLQHPYLNYAQCTVITDIRERKGAIKSMKRLGLLDEFESSDLERLKNYISFSINRP